MQIQAVCLPAIQLIPYYRGIQAKRMGRMDTQLMCAPGFRYERNKSTPRIIMQHSIISHGRFSVNRIDHLPRPVFRIRAEGEFNMTFFFLHNAIQPSNISFTHRPVLELCLQVLVGRFSEKRDPPSWILLSGLQREMRTDPEAYATRPTRRGKPVGNGYAPGYGVGNHV